MRKRFTNSDRLEGLLKLTILYLNVLACMQLIACDRLHMTYVVVSTYKELIPVSTLIESTLLSLPITDNVHIWTKQRNPTDIGT